MSVERVNKYCGIPSYNCSRLCRMSGWYLSMSPEDSFVRRLQPLQEIPIIMERNNRFGAFNNKTLGMLLVSDTHFFLFLAYSLLLLFFLFLSPPFL